MITDKLSDFPRLSEREVNGKTSNPSYQLGQGDLLNLAEIGFWTFDASGETTYVNDAMALLLGYSREKMLTLPMLAFTGPSGISEFIQRVRYPRQRTVEKYETKLFHRDGSEIHVNVTSIPSFDEAKTFLGTAWVVTDIPQSKLLSREMDQNNRLQQAEQTLRESEERYRTILASIQDGYFECALNGRLIFCNDAFCHIHGLDRETLMKADFRDHVTPETSHRIYQAFHQVYLSGEPLPSFEIEFVKPDGTARFVDESVSLIRDGQGNAVGFRGIVRDTTERKLAEEARRESEEKFRALANEAPVMIWLTGPDKLCTFLNQRWLEFTGRTMDEELGLGWMECVHPDDLDNISNIYNSAYEAREPFKLEYRVRRHDGVYRWILDSGMPRYAPDGMFLGYIGSCFDITGRKEAEDALRQSEERHRAILENIHDGYYEVNLAGHLTFANDGLVRMFGLESKEELLGANMLKFADEKHAHRLRVTANHIYRSGQPVSSFVYELRQSNGTLRNVDISLSPIKTSSDQPAGFRGIIRDVTEREHTEKLIEGQVKVLEMIATGAPLKETLEAIVRLAEEVSQNTICSILLLDDTGRRLSHGAAMNLPEDYIRQIDGTSIGPRVGSCGTAAYTQEMVIVTDIAQDPLWADYRDLALKHDLRACWSVPIFSTTRRVFGTFAVYYRETGAPRPEEVKLIETMANLASIAIEHARTEQKLQASEARFRSLTERSGEGISLLNPDGKITYTSPVVKTILGYEVNEVVGKPANDRIHPDDVSSLERILRRLSEQPGQSVIAVYRTRHKSGSWRWIESTFTNLLEEPNVRAIVVNFRDITERKNAGDALRISEERFAKAFSASPQPMCLVTLKDGRFIQVNDAWTKSVGLNREHVIGRTSTELNLLRYPMPREQFVELMRKEGYIHDLEVTTKRTDGQTRTQLFSFELLELDGQEVTLSVSMDITERKLAEDALRASEERFAKAFNSSPQPMAILELPSRTYSNVNDALVRSAGYTAEEMVGRTTSELNIWVNPAHPRLVSELLDEQGFVRNFEASFRTKSGEVREFLYSAEQIFFNGKPHILVVANDITERKRAEEALRQNEALLRSVIESNPDWIFVKDRTHRYKLVNQTYANSLHRQPEDCAGKNDLELGFPEEQVKGDPEKGIRGFWADDRMVFDTGRTRIIEAEPVEVDGRTHLFNTIKVPLFDTGGKVWGVLGVSRDITELKRAEAALRASEERFAKAFDASPQPMVIFEASERRIVNVNEAMVRTFGWSVEEMIGRTPADLNIWVDMEQQSRVRALLISQGFARNLEIKFRTKTGEVREFLYSAETISLNNHPHVLVVASDITERVQAERALQESEERYRLLFEHGFAGISRSTLDGQMLECNDALAEIFGCQSREEMLQTYATNFYFDQAERENLVEDLKRLGRLKNYERRMKRKDGSPVWTLANFSLHQRGPDGAQTEMVWDSIVLDITERKLAEQQLAQSNEQMRALAAHLETVREEERTRIAREIHDNLGQALTGLKLDFSWLDKNLTRATDENLRQKAVPKLKEIAQLLEETIQTVRHIATELRPGVLDTLGLSAAIDWQSREFARRSGIQCEIQLCQEPPGLSAECATALFRIFQEILTNIARHSRARWFNVRMAEASGDLILTVRDNGVGITKAQLRNPNSLGLIGMRERALIFGGRVLIEGRKGGTTVNVKMPAFR